MTRIAPSPSSTPHRARRTVAALGLCLTALAGTATMASAKEVGSGGGGTTTCSPVSSLSVKSDARVGETGLASIQASYSVKPCINGQTLTVRTTVSEHLNPAVVVWDNPEAPLSGKFEVFGVRVRVTYRVTVAAYDATTGAPAGSTSVFTAAIPKGV